MNIQVTVRNTPGQHEVALSTDGEQKSLTIAPKSSGYGSSLNGGELLCLAIATCYCNDLYREAAKRNIRFMSVEVQAEAVFGAAGEPGSSFQYKARVESDAATADIDALLEHTDKVAEIHNTLRSGTMVTLLR